MTQFKLQVTHDGLLFFNLETNDINRLSVDQLNLMKGEGLTEFKLQITHGNVIVADIDTDDVYELQSALFGFEYELTEMLSGACDE